jgi:hypothetical protein
MQSTPLSLDYEGNGWGGIRTPGAFRHTRFPGVHNRPLCHPSCTASSIVVSVQDRRICIRDSEAALQLQPPEQFVQWQLNTDVEFAEVGVLGADRIEAHFVNDRLDLERIARKQSHAPFCVVEAG